MSHAMCPIGLGARHIIVHHWSGVVHRRVLHEGGLDRFQETGSTDDRLVTSQTVLQYQIVE